MVALAVVATFILYWRYSTKPWTRDGQVRANVVGIAPRVAGPIIQIPIKDNQAVRKGDLLFEIDPSTFQAEVNNAAAKLKQAQAAEIQTQQELARQTSLYETKTNDLRDVQNAQDNYASAVANSAAAQANLETALSTWGTPKSLLPWTVTSRTSTPALGPMSTKAISCLLWSIRAPFGSPPILRKRSLDTFATEQARKSR
jgi:multidrug resistance efflux pump